MNKWEVTTDPRILRRVGKTGEELCEAGAVVCRIVIQGIDEVDPSSGKTNRQRLTEELADVRAQIDLTIDELRLDRVAIADRVTAKKRQMTQWEAHFPPTRRVLRVFATSEQMKAHLHSTAQQMPTAVFDPAQKTLFFSDGELRQYVVLATDSDRLQIAGSEYHSVHVHSAGSAELARYAMSKERLK